MYFVAHQAYYEVKLTEELPVDFGEDHQETNPHIIRVGWSMDTTSFQLGMYFNCLWIQDNREKKTNISYELDGLWIPHHFNIVC